MKTASGIGWPTPKAEVNQYLTRSSWSWVDRNQKSIIALLNYREFSFTKIEISIATQWRIQDFRKGGARIFFFFCFSTGKGGGVVILPPKKQQQETTHRHVFNSASIYQNIP